MTRVISVALPLPMLAFKSLIKKHFAGLELAYHQRTRGKSAGKTISLLLDF